ncbi:hypothetical protein WOLCODRAFT_166509 [Wolfiporia cocos MD-104 SS10]|uniref:Uncharacterized protein n=1 Tax=Wolfiporia cocos (strain MD-104) TaxID=742152 RepID=A0A2H3J0R7_WOLCO|nr:hypothetical protein WOLCODRAFT_166509 [Wolfiporia cocos MD-104 SS10]
MCVVRPPRPHILQLSALALAAFVLYTTPLLFHPFALVSIVSLPLMRSSCPPRAYANVSCVPRATAPASAAHADLSRQEEDVLARVLVLLRTDRDGSWTAFSTAAGLVEDLVKSGG